MSYSRETIEQEKVKNCETCGREFVGRGRFCRPCWADERESMRMEQNDGRVY